MKSKKEKQPAPAKNESTPPQPTTIGSLLVTYPPEGGVNLAVESSTIGSAFTIKFIMAFLILFMFTAVYSATKPDVLLLAIVYLMTLAVSLTILQPVRLGLRITNTEIILRDFFLFRIRQRSFPLSQVSHLHTSIYSSGRSPARTATLRFRINNKNHTALRCVAFSNETIRKIATDIEAVIKDNLTRLNVRVSTESLPETDISWPLGIAVLIFCLVSFGLRVYVPVFAIQSEILQGINFLLHKAHFIAIIMLGILFAVSLLKMNRKQIVAFAFFAVIGFFTYEKLLVPTRIAIVDYALSDTETVIARITDHGFNTVGDVKQLPRTFQYTFEYRGKKYEDFYPISEEVYNDERKKFLKVGAKIRIAVSKKFPVINKLVE